MRRAHGKICAGLLAAHLLGGIAMSGKNADSIPLPKPAPGRGRPLEETLAQRRSVREFRDEPVSLEEVAALCWAAQGVTGPDGYRAAPSAGALYPLELYVAAGRVEDLPAGLYRYDPPAHALQPRPGGDRREALCRAALDQAWVKDAPVVFVLTAVVERSARKYGDRAERYAWMEAGHAAQNLLLQATALGLAGVPVGAIRDEAVCKALDVSADETALYVLPVGRP